MKTQYYTASSLDGAPIGRQPWPYEAPTFVFTSRTLPAVPGADIRFVRGDVRHMHQAMVAAAGGKNVWIVGGELHFEVPTPVRTSPSHRTS